jgi:hypothetical protein
LLVAGFRRRKTAENCDDLDHGRPPSLRSALVPPIERASRALSFSLTGGADGKTLSYIARARRMRRIRSRSDFEANRITSPMFAPIRL